MISQYLILPTNQIYLNVLVKIVCVRKLVKKIKVENSTPGSCPRLTNPAADKCDNFSMFSLLSLLLLLSSNSGSQEIELKCCINTAEPFFKNCRLVPRFCEHICTLYLCY